MAAPAAIPEALPAPPVLDLPPFPSIDVGDIAVEFTFDPSGFPDVWAYGDVALGAIANVEHFGYQLDTVRRVLRDFRLVIVDEAHALKNRASAGWQLVNDLKKRFLLLLSATPVGNDLTELYNLIQLLRPGLLQGEARFRREYGRIDAPAHAGRRDRLRELLREVMVRNTRAHLLDGDLLVAMPMSTNNGKTAASARTQQSTLRPGSSSTMV